MDIKTKKTSVPRQKLTPMSLEEFYAMINQSERDFEEGRFISHEDLKDEIKTWHLKYTGQH